VAHQDLSCTFSSDSTKTTEAAMNVNVELKAAIVDYVKTRLYSSATKSQKRATVATVALLAV
jgi:hypothetical protein